MCKVYSTILTDNYSVLDHPGSDSHEDIIEKYHLQDDKIGRERSWLRAEVTPQVSLTSTDKKDWHFRLDEQQDGGLPPWYDAGKGEQIVLDHVVEQIAKGRYMGEWEGDLNLRDTAITLLPEGLRVGGDLNLSGTPITALPEGLTVGGKIYR